MDQPPVAALVRAHFEHNPVVPCCLLSPTKPFDLFEDCYLPFQHQEPCCVTPCEDLRITHWQRDSERGGRSGRGHCGQLVSQPGPSRTRGGGVICLQDLPTLPAQILSSTPDCHKLDTDSYVTSCEVFIRRLTLTYSVTPYPSPPS